MKKIAFIPLDIRPVSYDLPSDIIKCMGEFDILLPDLSYIGGLFDETNFEYLMKWLENTDADYLVVSLDAVAYGGLVASRRTKLTLEQVKNRIDFFKNIIIKKNIKTLAFSSIMRISNNNVNEEEKEYWNLYGKKIFDYSYNSHKSIVLKEQDTYLKASCISNVIPSEILDDYINTRKRNFEINKLYVAWLKEKIIDTLVFSKDDCAQYGFNVQEAQELQEMIAKDNLNGFVKTGADEIPLSLLSRIIAGNNIKILPVFTCEKDKNLISNYEDVSVEKSVEGQITLAGCKVAKCEQEADLILYVNNFETQQGELVMNITTKMFDEVVKTFDKPTFCADVRFANGADDNFAIQILNNFDKYQYGYTAWNTSANTLGCAICMALAKYCSKDFNNDEFLKLQMIRFLDDWVYQANVRAKIRDDDKNLGNNCVFEFMKSYEEQISNKLKITNKNVSYSFPWNRFFEIRINIK